MHLVFYGPEGSGKGTQAKLLSEKLKLPIYTTGDLVREAAANDKTDVGNLCRKVLEEGKYLPDVVVSQLIANKVTGSSAVNGFILDGFPRTKGQAEFLDKTVEKSGFKIDKFIYLNLSDEESVKRLSKRKRVLFGGSNILHDDPKRVRQRLAVYHKNEKDVIDFYTKKNLILEVNAGQTVEKVFRDIVLGLKLA
ncbi:nucleoside monophosphate kinase [Candidatus Gottesmanbacteria bacterium]|nr:nucleoside monophosphate kinase [Candidatus Gottesmanbacteria bacterium]